MASNSEDSSSDFDANVIRRIEKLLMLQSGDIIADDECLSSILDELVWAHTQGRIANFSDVLCALPRSVLERLLACTEAHPEPRLFVGVVLSEDARKAEESAALRAQAELAVQLKCHLRE